VKPAKLVSIEGGSFRQDWMTASGIVAASGKILLN
jgi:hypothetical protein